MKKKKHKKVAYMCGVSFQDDLDPKAAHYVRLYSNLSHLKEDNECWNECGIVKVEVEIKEWVEKQDFGNKEN